MQRLTPLPTPDSILEDIVAFDGLGWHRTGSSGDQATTRWLIDQLAAAGIGAAPRPFVFPRVDIERAEIATGAHCISGHPQFDAGVTPPEGIRGPLSRWPGDLGSRLLVLEVAPDPGDSSALPSRELDRFLRRCQEEGALGVLVIGRTAGSIAVRNAPHIETPSALPVLYLRPDEAAPVLAAADRGERATLTIVAPRRSAEAENVVGTLTAGSPDQTTPLIVLTPKSGWFHCATERGCGIAIWLAVARALGAHEGRKRAVVFMATSGHELGNMGVEALLRQRPEYAAAHAWVHLGASIGAAFEPNLGVRAADERLRSLAEAALARHDAPPCKLWPLGTTPEGEARNVAEHGGRYLNFAGSHAYFHAPEDRPDKVSAEATARYAAAVIDIARVLVGEED